MSCRIQAALVCVLLTACVLTGCQRAESEISDPTNREAEELFLEYLKINTSNPPGNETSAAVFFQRIFSENGIESRLIGKNPHRKSLWAKLASGSSEPALLLLHHTDVVPAEVADWTVPPFGGTRKNGYFWGRGALDDKSLGIAFAMAFLDLKRSGRPLSRDVIYVAVSDEETGGLEGTKELIESYPELFQGVGGVLNEGGSNDVIVDRVAYWGIDVDEKIPLWLRFTARGGAAHSAAPPRDGGAIWKLVEALQILKQGEAELSSTKTAAPSVGQYFLAASAAKPPSLAAALRALEAPAAASGNPSRLPGKYQILLQDSVSLTRLNAGTAVNVLPERATADLDVRLTPGSDPGLFLERVQRMVGELVSVEVLLAGKPTPSSPVESDLFRTVTAVMERSDPGSIAGPSVSAGTTDSRFFRERGIPSYGVDPFKVNYYDASSVHGRDERIRIRSFSQGVGLTKEIVFEYCLRRNAKAK